MRKKKFVNEVRVSERERERELKNEKPLLLSL